MSKQREFKFIECGDRVLCIDLDPMVDGEPPRGRIRIFVEESQVTLEPAEVAAAREALAVPSKIASRKAA